MDSAFVVPGFGASTTDGKGAFTLTVPIDTGYYLEIREHPMDSTLPSAFPEIYFARYGKPDTGVKPLGTLRMSPSGTLKGRLVDTSGMAPKGLWLGVEGLPGLVQLEAPVDSAGSPFHLPGLPPEPHTLILLATETPGGAPARKDVIPVDVKPGEAIDLGRIPYDQTGLGTSGGK